MLIFNSLGRKGNLGNQLFQIASTVGLAVKHNKPFSFPEWEYEEYFDYELPKQDKNKKLIQIVEKSYEFHDFEIGNEDYDINGALQSEKYFDIETTKKMFKFKDIFVDDLTTKYSHLFKNNPIFISVRRGDFVHHPHYYQLPYWYYILALKNNFSDWEERDLIFMSDNINYCKSHFKFLKKAVFLENLSAAEQLILGAQGTDFIISNSTFSWWLAWLGEKKNSKIVRPVKNFRGSFAKLNNDKDFFPERWLSFDYKKYCMKPTNSRLFIQEVYFQSNDFICQKAAIITDVINRIKKRISR
ncbi:Glycosyl transferase family 11 [Flavobacterium sp. CF108]|uniref:alpha-1,2-fucosyltransferase n=1 Tax=unclassified Flavobacterium TaxID=196869 RepID=UPI0008C53A3A|nr:MULTISPECIES: alpha-1,2-fucosyltransferase [unclassified Flavobacterium]SEO49258.1 Glycosyl transferase family 11 [Flavobacterium sp. fv08]SHH72033.1 Glycosyl transferase family 11 [Flavobacterium sp. CF108]